MFKVEEEQGIKKGTQEVIGAVSTKVVS